MAAARKGCVNSLWSGTERVRIGERLKATLAGVLELELLRCKQLDLVDTALDNREAKEPDCIVTTPGQQDLSPPDINSFPGQCSPEESSDGTVHTSVSRGGTHSRWSTLSWDASSDLLSPPTPDPSSTVHLESDSRPSSGFYSVSGSSLSDSCYSVSSEVAQTGPAPVRPQRLWDQGPLPDTADLLWSDGAVQLEQQQQIEAQSSHEPVEEAPASVPIDLEATGLSFLTDLCSGLGDSIIPSLLQLLSTSSPSSSSSLVDPKSHLDSRYCTDLVSRRTKEVYPYPSPLHAVALQSPLFTTQDQAAQITPSPESTQNEDASEIANNNNENVNYESNYNSNLSFTQLEQYITRLARQYHTRITASTIDLTSTYGAVPFRGVCAPGKSHGSTQSLSAFDSRNTPGSNITPCKSLLGNSTRVSLSTSGKKATRNSINLGNLPSATGEDVSINLHLNVNLNLTPGSSRSLVDTPKTGSCGALRSEFTNTSTASASSLSSTTSGPAMRPRPRISTCPSSLSHRSSLEVAPSYGSSHFCRSLDFSNSAPEHLSVHGSTSGSAPSSQRNSLNQEPKLSEEFPMVEEISRLSGLSRDVVVGLMEQGVELDIDCFDMDAPGDMRSHKSHLIADQSHDYTGDFNLNRPIQLSLSVTHSPQSQSSLTPPMSHSSSPIHPYQSNYMSAPPPYHHHHYYQHDLPSSTASSPASRPTPRARSPPRPLQASPMGATPLSVFRREAPFQCSLPRTVTRNTGSDHCGIQHRGGSLRQTQGGGWKKGESQQGLYRGKHASHKLIRAATVSSYAKREGNYGTNWSEEQGMENPKKSGAKLWSKFEGRLFGRESEIEQEEMDKAEYGFGWRRNTGGSYRRETPRDKFRNNEAKIDYSPMFSKRREDGERRSSSLRLSRRALFRSESQGLLVSRHNDEPIKRSLWVSSLDVGGVRKDEGVRLLRKRQGDKGLSSTASLFNLSRSESFEGSCQSLSPLSSPEFSPSPPRRTLQRTRSLRDLGKRVFGSMRSLSLKRKPSKK